MKQTFGIILICVILICIILYFSITSTASRPRTAYDVQIACIEAVRLKGGMFMRPEDLAVCSQFTKTSTEVQR